MGDRKTAEKLLDEAWQEASSVHYRVHGDIEEAAEMLKENIKLFKALLDIKKQTNSEEVLRV